MKTNKPYEILSVKDFSQLQRALSEFAGSAEYKALLSHYELARQAADDPQRLLLIKLFQEALESLEAAARAMPVAASPMGLAFMANDNSLVATMVEVPR